MPLPARRQAGFSLIEILVALLVAVILLTVALPLFLRAIHSYQLTEAARSLADILRLTRYEAIRLNKQANCVIQPYSGGDTTISMSASMTDSSGNALTGIGSATTVLFGVNGSFVAAGSVPGGGALPTSANLGGTVPASFAPTGGIIQFDARGAVIPTSGVPVNVFFLASAGAPDAGYRAVVLMPAGSMQIWSIDASGNWQELR